MGTTRLISNIESSLLTPSIVAFTDTERAGFTFFVGVVVYFWDMTLTQWISIYALFEIIENTSCVVYFIYKYLAV